LMVMKIAGAEAGSIAALMARMAALEGLEEHCVISEPISGRRLVEGNTSADGVALVRTVMPQRTATCVAVRNWFAEFTAVSVQDCIVRDSPAEDGQPSEASTVAPGVIASTSAQPLSKEGPPALPTEGSAFSVASAGGVFVMLVIIALAAVLIFFTLKFCLSPSDQRSKSKIAPFDNTMQRGLGSPRFPSPPHTPCSPTLLHAAPPPFKEQRLESPTALVNVLQMSKLPFPLSPMGVQHGQPSHRTQLSPSVASNSTGDAACCEQMELPSGYTEGTIWPSSPPRSQRLRMLASCSPRTNELAPRSLLLPSPDQGAAQPPALTEEDVRLNAEHGDPTVPPPPCAVEVVAPRMTWQLPPLPGIPPLPTFPPALLQAPLGPPRPPEYPPPALLEGSAESAAPQLSASSASRVPSLPSLVPPTSLAASIVMPLPRFVTASEPCASETGRDSALSPRTEASQGMPDGLSRTLAAEAMASVMATTMTGACFLTPSTLFASNSGLPAPPPPPGAQLSISSLTRPEVAQLADLPQGFPEIAQPADLARGSPQPVLRSSPLPSSRFPDVEGQADVEPSVVCVSVGMTSLQ